MVHAKVTSLRLANQSNTQAHLSRKPIHLIMLFKKETVRCHYIRSNSALAYQGKRRPLARLI